MATVIDELVIKLGLDPTELTKGQRDALESFEKTRRAGRKAAFDLEESGAKAAEGFFGRLKNEALGLFAVLIGADTMSKFIGQTVTGLTNVSLAAEAVGLDSQHLRAFGLMIEWVGGNAQQAQEDMANLQKTMQGWQSGTAIPGVDFLRSMSLIGAGRGDTPEQIFQKFAAYAARRDVPVSAALVAQGLGFNQNAEIVEAMKGSAQAQNDFNEAMKRTPSDEQIGKLTSLGRQWRDLGQEIKLTATNLLQTGDIIPQALSGWIKFFSAINSGAAGTAKALLALSTAVAAIATGIPGVFIGGAPSTTPRPPSKPAPPKPAPAGAAPPPQSAGARVESFLRAHGISADVAHGIAGGIFAETAGTFSPTIENPFSHALGLGQWLGKRKEALKARYGDHPTFDQQLEFLLSELEGGDKGGRSVLQSKNAVEALMHYVNDFMRPNKKGSVAGSLADFRTAAGYVGAAVAGGAASQTLINIGQITIHSAATDAKGVARDIGGALKSNLGAQANTGLTG